METAEGFSGLHYYIGVIEFRVYCLGFRVWIEVRDPVSFFGGKGVLIKSKTHPFIFLE